MKSLLEDGPETVSLTVNQEYAKRLDVSFDVAAVYLCFFSLSDCMTVHFGV